MITLDSRKHNGFTLIELVVVIAILGLMMAVAVPGLFAVKRWAANRACKQTLGVIKGAISMYKLTVGSYPQTLRDLIEKPSDSRAAAKWPGKLLEDMDEVPRDPWEQEIVYRTTPGAKHPFELYSEGDPDEADRQPISAWQD